MVFCFQMNTAIPTDCVHLIFQYADSITKIQLGSTSTSIRKYSGNFIDHDIQNATDNDDYFSFARYHQYKLNAIVANFVDIVAMDHLGLVKHCMANIRVTDSTIVDSLAQACLQGNVNMFRMLMFEKDENVNPLPIQEFFYYACESGNDDMFSEIVEMVLCFNFKVELGTQKSDSILYAACKSGNANIVKYVSEMGPHNWGLGFIGACLSGDLEIIKIMMGQVCGFYRNEMTEGIRHACEDGHLDIVKHMMACYRSETDKFLSYACIGPNLELIEFLYERESKFKSFSSGGYPGKCFVNLCDQGHYDLVLKYMDLGHGVYDDAFQMACSQGHVNIVELLMKKVTNYQAGFKMACYNDQVDVVRILKPFCEASKNLVDELNGLECFDVINFLRSN